MQKKSIHKSVYVDSGAKIGSGTAIWHSTHTTNTAVIGNNCKIGQSCYIAGKIGNNCKIQNNVNVYLGVTLEDFVFCGPNMTFTNDMNPRAKYPKNGKWLKTLVKTGATLAAGCVICPNITIGKWAFIGAGSVVTNNIPDYALVYGNPAKIKGFMCECGEKMPNEFKKTECKKCGRKYKKNDLKVEEIK